MFEYQMGYLRENFDPRKKANSLYYINNLNSIFQFSILSDVCCGNAGAYITLDKNGLKNFTARS